MEQHCIYLPYSATKKFSPIVIEYLHQEEKIKPFIEHAPCIDGIKSAINARKNYPTDRMLLVNELKKQYDGFALTPLQSANIEALLSEDTFTICTAHQPNIFTGHLYFIYKIFHAIKLAEALKQQLQEYNFVPIYYMGSEDADLDELGHVIIEGKRYEWKTTQSGAVGRMKVDKAFVALIDEMEGQLSVHPHGKELVYLFRQCYRVGVTIQQATLLLVHELFKSYGLLVLVPDNGNLKRPFNPVVHKELTDAFSFPLVQQTIARLGEHYKVQAGGRPINLFYLYENIRERIELEHGHYKVVNTQKIFSRDELSQEVEEHPERFSANVILRAVFQEMILPNVAFIGGGGELAYWLELKEVFAAVSVPYPVVVLRNSFMLVNDQQRLLAEKLGFDVRDLFAPVNELMTRVVSRHDVQLTLVKEKAELSLFYNKLLSTATKIDASLSDHVKALEAQHLRRLDELEKKMLRAEKRKHDAELRQLQKLKDQLFPNNGLQERVENFASFYAHYGDNWMKAIYDCSLGLEQQFCIARL